MKRSFSVSPRRTSSEERRDTFAIFTRLLNNLTSTRTSSRWSGTGRWFATGLLVVTDKRLIHVRGGVHSLTPEVRAFDFAEMSRIRIELESHLNTPLLFIELGSPTSTTIMFSLLEKKDTYLMKKLRLALQSLFDGPILDE